VNLQIGFIGLGMMGGPMASNLIKAGHKLVVHDMRREAAQPQLSAGAVWADSAEALARQSDIVFTSLPGPPEVEAIAQHLLAGLKKGSAYFDLSTNSPTVVRRLYETFKARGVAMLDAPISGGPAGAQSGKLALWVSGDEPIFKAHRKVLNDIGDRARYVGAVGAGTVAKLVHNCAGYIINCGLAEVFAMGVKAGVEPLALWEAVRQGAAGRTRTFDLLAGNFLPGKFDPPNFALKLAHKDVALATAFGKELGVPMRLANMTLEEMTEALARGWAGRDSRSFMLLELERAGVEIAVPAEEVRAAIERDGKQD
jgi:3-hydroxyisobutyrate dehydrogenase-like beta-hydroxyacid dehydrogenase